MNLIERWRAATTMYRAGTHPNQDKITLTLAEYLSETQRKKEET